ncbi:putative pantetheine-phosphate adenylyltransferase [Rhodotorula paludigena]|uniref:putative pantetheine-phosphate adenylyltransferase n=1 Tax=Rhodotorula paludigena TaxID=86838 RepID=UPI0031815D23
MASAHRTLVLAFPSLPAFLASSAHLAAVRSSALATRTRLLILVRTSPDAPSPWLGPAPAPETGTASSAHPAPPPLPAPTALFLPLERALARTYAAATSAFFESDDGPLKSVDVVVEQLRQVGAVCVNETHHGDVDRWEWDGDDDDVHTTELGKGKGRANDPAPTLEPAVPGDDAAAVPSIYPVVALGGTFDHLHAGHKILLTMACALCSDKLIVGVSDEVLLQNKKYKHLLEPLDGRIRAVEQFVALVRPSIRCGAVPLQDVYGPTAHDPSVGALVVSDETRSGGDTINTLRREKSLSQLDIYTISLVADDARLPSSAAAAARSPSDPAAAASAAAEVPVSAKMGSTGIREWLDRRSRLGGPTGRGSTDGETRGAV